MGWVVGVSPIDFSRVLGLWWSALSLKGLSKGSYLAFTEFLEKASEYSERLGRQVQPRIEPGTSRFLVRVKKRSATDGAVVK